MSSALMVGSLRRVTACACVLSGWALSGCTTDESGRTWVSKDVFSERTAPRLADCVGAGWRKFSAFVQVAPYEQGKAVRIVHPDLGVIFQAIVIPKEGGSVMTLGSPYVAQFPNYEPMAQKCAARK